MAKLNSLTKKLTIDTFVHNLSAIPTLLSTSLAAFQYIKNNSISLDSTKPYITWDKNKYTRNLVFMNDSVEIFIACWLPGQGSPVHDHAKQTCYMRILQGSLLIEDYQFSKTAEQKLLLTSKKIVIETSPMEDTTDSDIHAVSNISNSLTISLHINIRPVTQAKVYDIKTGSYKTVALKYDSANTAGLLHG